MSTPGGGFIQMETEEVAPIMDALSESGRSLDSAWRQGEAEITSNEAGIGGDLLGGAFRGIYADGSNQMRDNAPRVPAAMVAFAQVGTDCVAAYRAADARAAAGLPLPR